jgi:phosphonoacetaldehyde hydrolase
MKQINAVILDWAGTTVDFGSFAPTQIFVEAFKQTFDIDISLAEARIPMGLGKWQHIEALGKLPAVDARWRQKLGRSMSHQDIDALYQAFMPLQIAKVIDFADPIEGVPQVIAGLREQSIKIGSCSGRRAARLCAGLLGRHRRSCGRRPTGAVDGVAERHRAGHRCGGALREGR